MMLYSVVVFVEGVDEAIHQRYSHVLNIGVVGASSRMIAVEEEPLVLFWLP